MVNINYKNGILNKGDTLRIRRAMAKAIRGENITVGFLGGSITQGCLSSVPEKCYAYLVYEWWKNTFKEAEVKYVNAGIGGTPSDFGVARVDDDMLKYSPDFSIVEFSVNDVSNDYYKETYEGLVRHILKDKSKTGLMLVHNVRYDNMDSAEDKHFLIGKYYDLPAVSMKHSIYPEVANGSLPNRDITPDDLHPNDLGHELVAKVIIYALENILKEVKDEDALAEISFVDKKPLTPNSYENSVRLQNTNYEAKLEGFTEDKEKQNHITEMFRHGYTAWNEGDSVSFYKECVSISVQYRKSVNKPVPVAKAIIDDDEENAVLLDGNFEEDWGDCLYTQPVLIHGEKKIHKIEIRIIKDHKNEEIKDAVPFYLVSVIAASDMKEIKAENTVKNTELLFFEPKFKRMIWGGSKLAEVFGYTIPDDKTGECWAISAHPHGDCVCVSESYKGKSLSELWDNEKGLFGYYPGDKFPLLLKIIDAKEDLSIQVHPSDEYAMEHEKGSSGKTECWYILDCEEDSKLVVGHNAKTKEELCKLIDEARFAELIREVSIKKGDFIQIDPGTVHAIKGGVMILETQQNSDITYRVYDYGRVWNGMERDLHVEQSKAVITVPANEGAVIPTTDEAGVHFLNSCKYYDVSKVTVKGEENISDAPFFRLVSVIEGQGEINGIKIKKGDNFIIPNKYGEVTLKGSMTLITSVPASR